MLAGVVVATQLGVAATVFYLAVYLLMNMASFAVIVARERETGLGDSLEALAGLGRERPWLAWPMTISMLALAGIPATAGFIGKFYLIDAAVAGGYAWLGVAIVVGSMISLGYYLPVIAAMWMREAPAGAGRPSTGDASPSAPPPGALPALAGGSSELDAEGGLAPSAAVSPPTSGLQGEVVFVAVLAGRGDDLLRHHPPAAVRPGAPCWRRHWGCSEWSLASVGPSQADGGRSALERMRDIAEATPKTALVEIAEAEVRIEVAGLRGHRIDDDCPSPKLAAATHTASECIHEQVTAERPSMLGTIEREASKQHHRHRVWHPAPQSRWSPLVLDGTHREGVVADDSLVPTEHVRSRGAACASDPRGLA